MIIGQKRDVYLDTPLCPHAVEVLCVKLFSFSRCGKHAVLPALTMREPKEVYYSCRLQLPRQARIHATKPHSLSTEKKRAALHKIIKYMNVHTQTHAFRASVSVPVHRLPLQRLQHPRQSLPRQSLHLKTSQTVCASLPDGEYRHGGAALRGVSHELIRRKSRHRRPEERGASFPSTEARIHTP